MSSATASRPFIFPGSARSQMFGGADGNNNNTTNGRDRTASFSGGVENEFFFDASPTVSTSTPSSSNKRGSRIGSTPIENPLLFRSTPSSTENRNNPYPASSSTPLGSVPVNVIGSNDGGSSLRQRKGFMFDNRTTTTQQGNTRTDGTTYQRVLPPRASFTLQTVNGNYQQKQQQQSNRFQESRMTGNTTAAASTPIFGNTSIDQIPVDRTATPSVFTFNNNSKTSTLQISTTTDVLSPRPDTASMYSPSQVCLNNITSTAQTSNRNSSVTSTTTTLTTTTAWVLVFGATITQSIYEDLIHKLSEFGKIIGQRGRSNWLAVQYQNEFEVEKAVCHYRVKVRTNTDLVFYTIQRLTPNDPDMRMVLQQPNVSYHGTITTANIEFKPKSIWSTGGNDGLFLTYDGAAATTADDVGSVDTVVTSNKRLSSINNNSDSLLLRPSSTDLTEKDILNGPLTKSSEVESTAVVARPRPDSFCVKLLKLILQIEEDE